MVLCAFEGGGNSEKCDLLVGRLREDMTPEKQRTAGINSFRSANVPTSAFPFVRVEQALSLSEEREGFKHMQEMDMPREGERRDAAQPSAIVPYTSLFNGPVTGEANEEAAMRSAIAGHPLYPQLITANIECRKVGSDAEVAARLDELRQQLLAVQPPSPPPPGMFPQLDAFMVNYISMLVAFRKDLEKPFEEAHTFCRDFEARLNNFARSLVANVGADLAGGAEGKNASDSGGEDGSVGDSEGGGSLWGGGRVDPTAEEAELKQQLKQRYQPYLSSLKQDCLKKRKKGKLPREATQALLNWWQAHLAWPYPSEAEKSELAEATGLDPKQINNWFINQRKRHWGGPKSIGGEGVHNGKT